jgi:hypothetical protein
MGGRQMLLLHCSNRPRLPAGGTHPSGIGDIQWVQADLRNAQK